ncbi:hypothetical protein GYMLUDRAFT_693200 [Collybiopsis luxurians FD-317 M1]|uniref:Uncharacterized protein n=1 Tax=Collybiopsis luxurians FD-317 M1 TaxID=944289 RepID=A0A0D0CJN5_9AGAR|nr:hypothetical protein GYMLUDRAFT_693200 [Collybiopsis luxurians FD-317 M1]
MTYVEKRPPVYSSTRNPPSKYPAAANHTSGNGKGKGQGKSTRHRRDLRNRGRKGLSERGKGKGKGFQVPITFSVEHEDQLVLKIPKEYIPSKAKPVNNVLKLDSECVPPDDVSIFWQELNYDMLNTRNGARWDRWDVHPKFPEGILQKQVETTRPKTPPGGWSQLLQSDGNEEHHLAYGEYHPQQHHSR